MIGATDDTRMNLFPHNTVQVSNGRNPKYVYPGSPLTFVEASEIAYQILQWHNEKTAGARYTPTGHVPEADQAALACGLMALLASPDHLETFMVQGEVTRRNIISLRERYDDLHKRSPRSKEPPMPWYDDEARALEESGLYERPWVERNPE